MALTDKEKHDVVFYLGWSGKTLLQSSNQYNSVVNDRLNNLNDFIEKQVRAILGKLMRLDEKLECAHEQFAVKRVQDIEMNPDQLFLLKKERNRCLRELSDLLDIRIVKTGTGCTKVVI